MEKNWRRSLIFSKFSPEGTRNYGPTSGERGSTGTREGGKVRRETESKFPNRTKVNETALPGER